MRLPLYRTLLALSCFFFLSQLPETQAQTNPATSATPANNPGLAAPAGKPDAQSMPSQASILFGKGLFAGPKVSLPYRLLKPETQMAGKKYPLIISLHGSGERGSDNELQLKYITELFLSKENRADYPCYVLAPQCPADLRWADYNFRTPDWKFTEQPSAPMEALLGLIDQIISENAVDTLRLYVTGMSMGGNGTFDLVMRSKHKIAAAAPICGWGDTVSTDRLLHTAFRIYHGDQDPAVPVMLSRNMYHALVRRKADVSYTEYPGVDHFSWVPAYKDAGLLPWMFKHKCKRK